MIGAQYARNVVQLSWKELQSLRRDPVMLFLIVYAFTVSVYTVAHGMRTEVRGANIAVIDTDQSRLSLRIRDALQGPIFRPPAQLDAAAADRAMDAGAETFVLDLPHGLEADLLRGRPARIQLNVDATAISQAGIGAAYIQRIIGREVAAELDQRSPDATSPVTATFRAAFNPNLESLRYYAVMQVIQSITILSLILVGAAVIREREHGTIEHLLVLPVHPWEIVAAKILANGAVILLAAWLSLHLVVHGILGVPLAGSITLLLTGATIYLFAVTALGVLLATWVNNMPQFGLLAIPVFVVMNLLSGTITPIESMPAALRTVMQVSPSTHFVAFAQGVLYRGADLSMMWPKMVAMSIMGAIFVGLSLIRFRAMLARAA
ncbi:MAG: ABC transporter permease [Alsobacter sp.]